MLEGFDRDRRLLCHRPDSVTAALGIHLIVYCAVGACLAFGLYALLQPSRAPNSGWRRMTHPPGAVVKYGKPSLATTVAEPIAPVELPIAAAALIDLEPATTGRSTPEPEIKPTIAAPPSQPRTAKRPNREVRIDSPSSGAQRAFRGMTVPAHRPGRAARHRYRDSFHDSRIRRRDRIRCARERRLGSHTRLWAGARMATQLPGCHGGQLGGRAIQ